MREVDAPGTAVITDFIEDRVDGEERAKLALEQKELVGSVWPIGRSSPLGQRVFQAAAIHGSHPALLEIH
jgi:hypothetical protein